MHKVVHFEMFFDPACFFWSPTFPSFTVVPSINPTKKMFENRSEDALVLLVKLVETVKIVLTEDLKKALTYSLST